MQSRDVELSFLFYIQVNTIQWFFYLDYGIWIRAKDSKPMVGWTQTPTYIVYS